MFFSPQYWGSLGKTQRESRACRLVILNNQITVTRDGGLITSKHFISETNIHDVATWNIGLVLSRYLNIQLVNNEVGKTNLLKYLPTYTHPHKKYFFLHYDRYAS